MKGEKKKKREATQSERGRWAKNESPGAETNITRPSLRTAMCTRRDDFDECSILLRYIARWCSVRAKKEAAE